MKSVVLSLAVVGMTALTGVAQAREDDKLCATLRQAERALTDTPLTVTILKLEPFETACQRGADHAWLCRELMAVLPLEHTHVYPWRVRGCLEKWGRKVRIQTADGVTGLTQRKIVRLESRSPKGVEWLLTFTPENPDDGMDGYYGRFALTLTPKASHPPVDAAPP